MSAFATPLLYSYRRCPYAMRARMALKYAGVDVDIIEISLNNKPAHLLQVSPKGTVPVLVLPNGTVLEQSLEIMYWAVQQRDADGWLSADNVLTQELIAQNDGSFKQALDKYKYANRFPEYPAVVYREQGEVFLAKLEERLACGKYLLGDQLSLADIAIFPFIRQFSGVDNAWFEASPYAHLRAWRNQLAASKLFISIMEKQPKP